MVFQKFTATSYRAVLDGLVAQMTSQHISAASVNNAGSGYAQGDILTITHAGAYHDATIEVLTVSSGAIATFRIRNRGAFSNRVASAVVNAGGTGYTTGEIVKVSGGTATEAAKLQVTASAGVVTGVSVYESGGAYSSAPGLTGAATVGVGPASYGGNDDLTVDLTMTGLIGTTGISATGGSGTGATFDLTLTATGWDVVHDRNDFSDGSATDQREVVVRYDRTGADDIYLGYRNYTNGSTVYGIKPCGFAGFNSGLGYDNQAIEIGGAGLDSNQPHCPLVAGSADVWLNVSEYGVVIGTKVVDNLSTVYLSAYHGLLVPFGTTSENPYPMLITGFTFSSASRPSVSDNMTGLATLITGGTTPTAAVARYYRASDSSSLSVCNWQNAAVTPARTTTDAVKLCPLGQVREPIDTAAGDYNETTDNTNFNVGVSCSSASLGISSVQLRPTPDSGGDIFLLIPLTLVDDLDSQYDSATDRVVGQIPGACWVPGWKSDGTTIAPEDTITNQSDQVVHALPSGQLTEPYAFTGIEES
jgi:hypothetical protein